MDLRLVPMMDHPDEFDVHTAVLVLRLVRSGIFP